MRMLANILGSLAVLAGFGLMYLAYETTTILSRAGVDASAIQVTQVYSQASFYGIMAIACFGFAAVVTLGGISSQLAEDSPQTSYTPPVANDARFSSAQKPKDLGQL